MKKTYKTTKEILAQPTSLSAIKKKLHCGESSRMRLAQWACQKFKLRDARGAARVSSCLKALRDLERNGCFRLPPRLSKNSSPGQARRLTVPVMEPKEVPGEVGKIRNLSVVLVKDEAGMRIWNELMAREHPQGKRRLVGRQLRYLVNSAHGWLGAVGFSASALYLEDRDRWIGWDAEQRRAHEGRVVNLSRLLIRPSVRCQNLASYVLGACRRRVANDFETAYGYRPWLLESFVDRDAHVGTCFQAANWERIGRTKGRGRNDRLCRAPESVKDIYVDPLVEDFRQRMGVRAEAGLYFRPLGIEEGLGKESWVNHEFGDVELGDKRLRERLMNIVETREKNPDGSYLEASGGDRYAAKGYYSFIDNPRDTLHAESILSTHRKRTMERMMSHRMVLVIQDTTDLNFSTRPHTEGLGLIGTNQTSVESLGLKLHTSLALSPEGLPLGVLRSVGYAPERKKKGEARPQVVGRPVEEKKTFRWLEGYRDCVSAARRMPGTRLLTVMDREADILELFMEAEPTRHRVGILVRARYNRRLEGKEKNLFETVKGSPHGTSMTVVIPRQRGKKAKREDPEQKGLPSRKAALTVRFQKITVTSERRDLRAKGPMTLWGVHAREENPPAGAKPIEWMLLTTEEIQTAQDAARLVGLYCRRWRIEEWHRVLKSGCQAEGHQHMTAERLKRAVAIDAVLAWRIQLMTLLGREVPDLPCTVFFSEWEIKILEATREENQGRKNESPLSLGTAITLVAQLGGYLARGCDSPPGTECLWQGMIRLNDMAEGYRLMNARNASP